MQEGLSAREAWHRDEVLRRKRRLDSVYRRRRIRLAVGFSLLCLLIALILVVTSIGSNTEQASTESMVTGDRASASGPISATGEARPPFARLGDRNLILPVAAGDATIIAYQPVNDERTVSLTPIGDQANANAVVRFFRGIFSGEPVVRYHLLDGEGGSQTSSVLIGAPAGSPVTAPVSGVVTGVKEYKLYGKYDDVQIDIRPEELSSDTVTMLFISDPVVSIGEVVSAGKTQLGKVRESPPELAASLAKYTHDSGSHLHMWVTEESID